MTTPKLTLLPALLVAIIAYTAGIPAALAQPALPGAPTNLQATVSGNNLSLTWDAPLSGGAPSSYTLIARATAGGAVLVAVPVGNVTAFAAAGPNGVFVLSVVASNAGGSGPESSPVTITLPSLPTPPGPPSNLVASALGSTATFTWNAPSSGGVVGTYLLTAGLTPGFAVPVASIPLPATSPGLVVPGVPAGTYYVRVAAQNAGGTSAPSNEAVLTIAGPAAPGVPTLNQPSGTGNTLNLSWTAGGGGTPTSYVLTALTTGGVVLASIPVAGTSVSFANVPNGTYVLRLVAVNAVGASPASNPVTVTLPITAQQPITPVGGDITSSDGGFGRRLALSANGQRLVITAYTTTNGTTRVYDRASGSWAQIGGDIIGEASGDRAGSSVDINAAGTRVAVGAYLNDGGGAASGHVRVYDLVGSTWTQVGADIDGGGGSWGLGGSVALSADGNRLVAAGSGVNNTTGHVKVFDLVGGVWTQVGATLTAGNEFGYAVDLSGDGTTLAVSSPSAAVSSRAGTAQVFRLSAGAWTQVGNPLQGGEIGDNFGDALAISGNGSRIAVGAPHRDLDGRVQVFDLVGGTWTQVGADVIGNIGLGETVTLSSDGTRLAAAEASFSVAKVFALVGGAWTQVGTNLTGGSRSEGLALSADGGTVAVGFIYLTPARTRAFSIAP